MKSKMHTDVPDPRAFPALRDAVLKAMKKHKISRRCLSIHAGVSRQSVQAALKRDGISHALHDRYMATIAEIVAQRKQ